MKKYYNPVPEIAPTLPQVQNIFETSQIHPVVIAPSIRSLPSSTQSTPVTSPRSSPRKSMLFSPKLNGLKRNSSLTGSLFGSCTSLESLDKLSLLSLSSYDSSSATSSAANSPHLGSFTINNPYFTNSGCFSLTEQDESQEDPLTHTTNKISLRIIRYTANSTRDEDLAAYIIKFTSDFYDSVYSVCQNLPTFISYRAHNDPAQPSHRRYSLLDANNKPIATGKWPPLASKTNSGMVLGKGHIMRDADLQAKAACPIDNNTPGALPVAIQNMQHERVLTLVYQQDISKNICKVSRYSGLICWEEKVKEYKDLPNNTYEETSNLVSKFFIQEAERLYSIISKMEDDTYSFNTNLTKTNQVLYFNFNNICFKIKIDELINLPQQTSIKNIPITSLQEFRQYIESHNLQDFHAPIWRLDPARNKYIPVMTWCGPHGHITGDADPHHFTKPFSMPRIAYYGIFNSKTSDASKFINGFKLLHARLSSANKESYIEYINQCSFDLCDYIHPLEIEYIKDPESQYINYIDPAYAEYNFYLKYINLLQNTIITYTDNPELLKLVCESDLNSIITQHALNHPMSYHAGEDLNPHASDFGVILSCLPDLYNKSTSETPRFIVTENEASYLALLFSDRTILQTMLFGVNAQWVANRPSQQYLNRQWVDLIEIQALLSAQISEFEFDMYHATIIKILDRRKPGEIQRSPLVQYAVDTVDARLNNTKLIINHPKLIANKINSLYEKYSAQIFSVAMQMQDYENIDDEQSEDHLQKYYVKPFALS